jgi:hypothetical protein
MVFKNRKWKYLDRKWNYFSQFQSSDQKTSLTHVSPFGPHYKMILRNRKWKYQKRKWNYFSHVHQKTSLTKVSPFGLMISKWFSETGNGII